MTFDRARHDGQLHGLELFSRVLIADAPSVATPAPALRRRYGGAHGTLSISGALYRRIRAAATARGTSIAGLIEQAVADLGGVNLVALRARSRRGTALAGGRRITHRRGKIEGLGAAIYAFRVKLGLSQDALGELLGVTGATVMRWELDRRTPWPRHIAALVERGLVVPGGAA